MIKDVHVPPLYILGSSGHAQEVAAYAQEKDSKRQIFFVDDFEKSKSVISTVEYNRLLDLHGGESIMGAGQCTVRKRMRTQIRSPIATIIHPSAVVLGIVAPGCVIAPNAVIAPSATLDEHVLVNYNATVGHDTLIQTCSVVGPGSAIGGWCKLEACVYVGAGALVRERIIIQSGVTIGMGAVVIKNVPADTLVIGVPAKAKVQDL